MANYMDIFEKTMKDSIILLDQLVHIVQQEPVIAREIKQFIDGLENNLRELYEDCYRKHERTSTSRD